MKGTHLFKMVSHKINEQHTTYENFKGYRLVYAVIIFLKRLYKTR